MVSRLAIQKAVKVELLTYTKESYFFTVYETFSSMNWGHVLYKVTSQYGGTLEPSASWCLFLWRNTDLHELLCLLLHYSHVIPYTSRGCVIALLLYRYEFSVFVLLMWQPTKSQVSKMFLGIDTVKHSISIPTFRKNVLSSTPDWKIREATCS